MGMRRTFQNLRAVSGGQRARERDARPGLSLPLERDGASSLTCPQPARNARRPPTRQTGSSGCAGSATWPRPLRRSCPTACRNRSSLHARSPDVHSFLLLDEPAAGMNPEESRRVADTVRAPARSTTGITRAADRARHAGGHDGVRSGRRARPRREDRRRLARRGQARARGDQGLSGRRGRDHA